jgi:predicted CoA-binding protein
LAAVPKPISVVSVVTPPAVTLQVLHQVAALGLDAVFLQDGSFDRAVRDYVAVAPFDTVYDACIMVVTA